MKRKLTKPPLVKSIASSQKSTSKKLILPFFILTVIFTVAYLFIPKNQKIDKPAIAPAYAVYKKGMYDSSMVLLNALKKNPIAQLNDSIYLLEADYHLKKGAVMDAIKSLENGIKLTDSTSSRLYFRLGKIQLTNGNTINTLDDFFSGLVIEPTNDSAWYYCGYIQAAHTSDYKNALKSFEQALALNPKYKYSFNLLLWKGIAYQEIQDHKNALNQFDQAIKLTTDNKIAKYYKAKSLFLKGDSTDACKTWEGLKNNNFELAKFALDAYCN